jgi:hypothetical protein
VNYDVAVYTITSCRTCELVPRGQQGGTREALWETELQILLLPLDGTPVSRSRDSKLACERAALCAMNTALEYVREPEIRNPFPESLI